MSEFRLEPRPFLGGHERDFGPLRLAERTGLGIVSLAVPLGGEKAAAEAAGRAFGLALPAPGRSVVDAAGEMRLVWMAPDQLFAVFPHPGPGAEAALAARLGEAFYLCDQSDAWVALEIEGAPVRRVLERICPLDLDADAFPVDAAQRTVMEHLAVIIIRTGDDRFLMLSPSSSARSFLHAVELSITNAI